ncbi:methylenetetrahydrofolate reductase [NAD(P)H] [Gluconobacter sp. LMG 31484]|uniref:Methylenetetrahydrofolate reductase n=1 Tax=Gluconobacter vitians TaxID=2728102 RepID=A0ABR9Y8I8_9PROT|nr:methylenetetrahydrofolate reductase [NAD(P)H] [Gluconobacter vitians]MBF0860065.1 methylenetetrahydrofolate reductase [NAD(P)H] [Gluconobacter vitians]
MSADFSKLAPLCKPRVSFEFFPPKTPAAAEALENTASRLAAYGPGFMSVTYGAGGSTRDRSIRTAERLGQRTGVPVAGHLTCVGASRQDVDDVARAYWNAGVRHIVALRGDAPDMEAGFVPHPEGYRSAAELVRGLRDVAPFEIAVAAYPEVHPEALSAQADLDNLRRKLDAGATRAITQFFFTPEAFLRFRDRAVAAGITAEIVPGILPIGNVAQARKFAEMCGAHIPDWLLRQVTDLEDQPEVCSQVTTALAAMMCRELQRHGVESFHLYTLNRAEPGIALCRLLGLDTVG